MALARVCRRRDRVAKHSQTWLAAMCSQYLRDSGSRQSNLAHHSWPGTRQRRRLLQPNSPKTTSRTSAVAARALTRQRRWRCWSMSCSLSMSLTAARRVPLTEGRSPQSVFAAQLCNCHLARGRPRCRGIHRPHAPRRRRRPRRRRFRRAPRLGWRPRRWLFLRRCSPRAATRALLPQRAPRAGGRAGGRAAAPLWRPYLTF